MKDIRGIFTACGFLVFALVYLGMTLTYPPEARLFPMIVLTVMVIMCVFQLCVELLKRPAFAKSGEAEEFVREDPVPESRMLLYTALAVVIIWAFGLVTGLCVYLLLYFSVVSRLSWKKNLLITAGTALFYYILFAKVLEIFYRGVLGIFI